ncbi:MAG: ribonuclease HII [Burkholderiaceae bacterium]
MSQPMLASMLGQPGTGLVAGVDEAGRGPLAGAVVAAAVILDPASPIDGLRDSKRLSAARREALALQIRHRALAWGVGQCSCLEIDQLNILQATMLAMTRAVQALGVEPSRIEVDGNRIPEALKGRAVAIVRGDATRAAISAASILAKTARDEQMLLLHRRFPQYGFDRHMGYPTAQHRQALLEYGPCEEHRRSFAPVREALHGKTA